MAHITNVVDRFCLYSVIDTCAIWHLLSSNKFYRISLSEGCNFVMSGFVEYEALYKPRNKKSTQQEMMTRLRQQKELGRFVTLETSIDDLQDIAMLEESKKLGIGELSAIALARKLNISVTTDDKKAFMLAVVEMCSKDLVQTIPQLLGWLVYNDKVSDGDVHDIICEHIAMGQSHQGHFEELYFEGMRLRLCKQFGK
jgi:phosphoribosylformylglycinamidine (FGAM) synthase PurS component